MALLLLGLKDRAQSIATHLLARHPLSEGLLRLKLNELDDRDDVSAIHALTDGRLLELPASVLGVLAEISANQGDLAWHSAVMDRLEATPGDPEALSELRVLSIHARWAAGNRAEAVAAAQTYLVEHPKHILARVLLGQMLKRLEQEDEALQQAEACFNLITAETHSFDMLKVADLLYSLRKFSEAGSLYSRLMRTPSDDEITRRLLVCLVESDQRRHAQDMLHRLSAETRALPAFRRIEANLARRMGDWAHMREILAQELKTVPDDVGVAMGYIKSVDKAGAALAEPKLAIKHTPSLPRPRFSLT